MIKINQIEYQNYQQGYQIRDSLTNELHSAIITIESPNKLPIKKFDIAEFEDKKWIVGGINTLLDGSGYNVTITIFELTLYLEKFVLSPCSFTITQHTLLQQIENKLFYKVEPLRVGETPRFKLTQRMKDFLNGKPGEDFIYTERMTLREIIDDMLSKYGVRAYVSDISYDFNEVYIDYLDLNFKTVDIKTLDNISHEEDNESAEYYGDVFDVSVQNAQSKNKTIITDSWTTLKPIEGTIADSNSVRLITSYNIEEILKVKVRLPVKIFWLIPGTITTGSTDVILDCDITSMFVEKEIYDAMPKDVQEQHIPYARNTNSIGVLQTYKKLFLTRSTFMGSAQLRTGLYGAIYDRVESWCTENGYLPYINPDEGIYYPFETAVRAENVYETVLFQVVYNPYISFNFKQTKDMADVNKGIASVFNQTDRNVDIDRYSEVVRTVANMVGNKELIREVSVKNKNELLQLGSRIDDNFSLVSRSITIYDYEIKCIYTFIQNYQANVSARLSRERRLFNIPQEDLVHRNIIIKDNLLVSTSPINVANDSLLTNDELTYIVKSFFPYSQDHGYIDKLLFRTKYGASVFPDNGMYILNFNNFAIGKSLIWQAKMYDNYSVGLSTTSTKTWGGKVVHLNPYVFHTGEASTIELRFIKSRIDELNFSEQLDIGKTLPLVLQFNNISLHEFSKPNIEYYVDKDRLEVLEIIYQLEANSYNDNKVVIGNYLMQFINLFKNKDIAEFKVWANPSGIYNSNDLNYCKGVVSSYNLTIDEFGYKVSTDYPVELLDSWAIGTTDGRLLLAVNNKKQPLNTIYFGLKRS